ncbi:reverse transcriptase domain-containing protein [Tanacetum coccineum]
MQTRSSSKFVGEPSTNPTSTILKRRNRRRSKQRVEPFSLKENPVVTMADQRTMEQLLQAPTEGYGDAIVIPAILAKNYELKHGLLNLVTSKPFYGFEKEDPHAHIRWFNKITSTEAWERFKDLLRACPHHGFTELHQLDTFYNALTTTDQDSLNAAAGVSTNVPSSSSSTPQFPEIAALADAVKALVLQRSPPPASVKAVEEICVTCAPIDEPVVALKSKPSIHYPSRANKQNLREKDDNLALKFVEIFRELHFELSFADALLHMPKLASIFKSLLNNKEKLFDLATLPLSIWKKLSFPELTPTQMILELADRSTTSPSGIAEDVFVKVGKFHFLADFVVVDYVVDPRVPLILERPFLRTTRTLIDVYGEELTLRVDDEAITFKVGQTLRYSYNDARVINQNDVIGVAF